jgi:hypothetical protein
MKNVTLKTAAELNKMSSTELRAEASRLGIKNYTKYNKGGLLAKIIDDFGTGFVEDLEIPAEEMKVVLVEKAPKAGTKSEKILAELRKGGKSMYSIANEFDTYVSVVLGVKRRYLVVAEK